MRSRETGTVATPNLRVIKASEVRRFTAMDDFVEVVRKLYLPHDAPRWQQLVRAAVLVVGTVEEWVRSIP